MSEPITQELRGAMGTDYEFCDMGGHAIARDLTITQAEFDRLCDAIDAVHANLERENARLKAELDRVLGEAELDSRGDSMHGGGSITDELRDFAKRWPCTDYRCKDMLAIADRIDAEHEKSMSRAGQLLADVEKDRDYNYANWQDCKQKVLQGNITFNELNAKIERLEDDLSHCIELPKDAGGEYIHEHDKVDWRDHAGTWHENATVVAVCNDGCYVMDGIVFHVHKSDIRHHHALTVEDMLRKFARVGIRIAAKNGIKAGEIDFYADEEAIAEYAAKLRLAGDAAGPNELAMAYHVGYDDALAKRKPDANKVASQ